VNVNQPSLGLDLELDFGISSLNARAIQKGRSSEQNYDQPAAEVAISFGVNRHPKQ
jgi:hypothetical protein